MRAEAIGNPDCPLMYRWTLLSGRFGKLLVHHFMPGVKDPDVHDHPRSFVTIVLRGSYNDFVPCVECDENPGWSAEPGHSRILRPCPRCRGTARMLGERMQTGMVRVRAAEHRHATEAGPRGCWTVCIMGPTVRRWGFWRDGRWWPFREYEERFGFTRRCEDR